MLRPIAVPLTGVTGSSTWLAVTFAARRQRADDLTRVARTAIAP
ncbi:MULTISPECIES: hypothetical protein [Amycolatopsis]|nr:MULTISPECIES: hypothetical protein [Amycolatopsis]